MSTMMVEDGTEFPFVQDPSSRSPYAFLVVVERGKIGWGAYVPDLDGVVAAADTEEEVRSLIAEAVDFHLEGLRAGGERIPQSASNAHWVLG